MSTIKQLAKRNVINHIQSRFSDFSLCENTCQYKTERKIFPTRKLRSAKDSRLLIASYSKKLSVKRGEKKAFATVRKLLRILAKLCTELFDIQAKDDMATWNDWIQAYHTCDD